MKASTYHSSIRQLRMASAALVSSLCSPHIIVQHGVKVPDLAKLKVGTDKTKAKRNFIRASLHKSLVRAASNLHAKLCFTPVWKYNNRSRAVVVGWPEWIVWDKLAGLQGHDTSYDVLVNLITHGHLYIQIASATEWVAHQAEGASRGITIYNEPRDTAPRCDISHRRSSCHIRPKLRPVRDVPKSAAYIDDSDIEDFGDSEAGPGADTDADEIQPFSDDF